MNWIVSTPPATLPLTLDQMRTFLRIDSDDTTQDGEITDQIGAAVSFAEQSMECSLITRTITATYYEQDRHDGHHGLHFAGPTLHATHLPLRRGPLITVSTVTDGNNSTPTWRVERYGHAEYLVVTSAWAAPLTVVYTAGFGSTAANVPADIRQAMKAHVGTMFENRESVSDRTMVPVPHSLVDFYARHSRGGSLS